MRFTAWHLNRFRARGLKRRLSCPREGSFGTPAGPGLPGVDPKSGQVPAGGVVSTGFFGARAGKTRDSCPSLYMTAVGSGFLTGTRRLPAVVHGRRVRPRRTAEGGAPRAHPTNNDSGCRSERARAEGGGGYGGEPTFRRCATSAP